MTLGVALCVRSNLGSSVISSLPYVLSLAGPVSFLPEWTIGHYTILMNFVFVICQILILRKQFELVQLFQLLVGFVFGWLIDFNMWLTDFLTCETLVSQILTQLAGCTVMGIGIAFEIKCGSVTMPGEGISIAVSRVSKLPFPKAKIIVDTTLVIIAVVASFIFFGRWIWSAVGIGTSALVQYEIDGAVGMYSGIFNNPFMIWGRYRRHLWKRTLTVSFQFHHTQMDGAHAAEFLDNLQKEIEGLSLIKI